MFPWKSHAYPVTGNFLFKLFSTKEERVHVYPHALYNRVRRYALTEITEFLSMVMGCRYPSLSSVLQSHKDKVNYLHTTAHHMTIGLV